ncbi:cupin-like domain-containing protein [Sphingomonas sp. FW199]|uniref:cupin-like domain-containing protein n=1 Tax=Sphingomonas sp. FW199 TaxID=3400217 RepID=UPI003CF2E5EE
MALTVPARTRVIDGTDAATLPIADLIAEGRPAILRGIARDLPLVAAGRAGPDHAIAYLKSFDGGRPITVYCGDPSIGGRFGYADEYRGLNFSATRAGLSETLDRIAATLGDPAAPSLYVGSTDLDLYLPGLRAEAALPFGDPSLAAHPPLVSIWIGNRTTARAHFDMSNNIAVTMVGGRRFTLFPPDQIGNLYPGPLDPTPAGQVISTVDFAAPDLSRHPGFADALAAAEVAEMEPGDALIYPALWWHQVEALDPFNAMINYWWNQASPHMDTPMLTLLHGLLSLRDRPDGEKAAWRALFDHYVFGPATRAGDPLPPHARGPLAAPMDPMEARRLRAMILQKMNR